ncbi:MAG: hypothetical protein HWE07_06035 [Cytophagia bacterium]|nr:hypothetical protein [Cytophagia bacterium]
MKKSLIIIIVPILILFSCRQKTYLSDDFKNFVPYEVNQELVFISSKGGFEKLIISSIEDNRFPDGINPPKNEIMQVYGKHEPDSNSQRTLIPILTGIAGNKNKEEQIIFEVLLGHTGTTQRVSFSKIKNKRVQVLRTNYKYYEDVILMNIVFENTPKADKITSFYWSLSKGYVRFVQQDGTIWDLKE